MLLVSRWCRMVHGLAQAYEQIKAAGGTIVVMKGEGRAFCSGGDVAAVREEGLVRESPLLCTT